ncbi:MAG: hypothetical protein HYX90_03500, partial [Chloroflexi bacterium]|nr:hypothetical protein [Chloroflexota bacterium]
MPKTSSAKQLRFFAKLRSQMGQPASDDELDAFARLSVMEASDKISELQQGSQKPAGVPQG